MAMRIDKPRHDDSFCCINDIYSFGGRGILCICFNCDNSIRLYPNTGIVKRRCIFFHGEKSRASVRAAESNPVEVFSMDYATLSTFLNESEPAREALHQAADKHEKENVEKRQSLV